MFTWIGFRSRWMHRLLALQAVLLAFTLVAVTLWGAQSSGAAASISLLALSLPAWVFAAHGCWEGGSGQGEAHAVGDYLTCGLELYRLEQLREGRALVENCASLERIELPREGLRLFSSVRRGA